MPLSKVTAPTRAELISQLTGIYTELYENEPEDSYDMPSAVQYWWTLPYEQLCREWADAGKRLKEMKA